MKMAEYMDGKQKNVVSSIKLAENVDDGRCHP